MGAACWPIPIIPTYLLIKPGILHWGGNLVTQANWEGEKERETWKEKAKEEGGCIHEGSEWQLRRGEAGEGARWVNVVRLTDRLETVGY